MSGESWQAISAIATMAAVFVALFGERVWKYLSRPQPQLKVFDLRSKGMQSRIGLCIENPKDPIIDAAIYYVGCCYTSKVDNKLKYVRSLPERFEWYATSEKETVLTKLYGEEPFSFLTSTQSVDGSWKPQILAKHIDEDSPFIEFKNDPNFQVTIYLKLKGSNLIGKIWPIDIVSDTSTVGGWAVLPRQEISFKEFSMLFPNHAEVQFKHAVERLKR